MPSGARVEPVGAGELTGCDHVEKGVVVGLDLLGLYAIQLLARDRPNFGSVLTLGWQEIHLRESGADLVHVKKVPLTDGLYCEELLRSEFRATSVDSLDASDFEGATLIHDLNESLPLTLANRFNVVLDFGTLEHVFDVKTAFENVNKTTQVGGSIVHVVPSNGCSGHGLYQFSPEFFHTFHSEERGFEQTRVWVASPIRPHYWFKVPKPRPGERVNLGSRGPMYLVCITKKFRPAPESWIQQSDYAKHWARGKPSVGASSSQRGLKGKLKRYAWIRTKYSAYLAVRHEIWADIELQRESIHQLLRS